MLKLYEDFDLTLVGYLQSVLEADGLKCLLTNQYSRGALGELPVSDALPTLWLINPSDEYRAKTLLAPILEKINPVAEASPSRQLRPWTCPKCRETIEAVFGRCWSCGTAHPEDAS